MFSTKHCLEKKAMEVIGHRAQKSCAVGMRKMILRNHLNSNNNELKYEIAVS